MRNAALESVAVGFFDGVHLGHQAILGRASRAFTFANHPLSVLAPERAPRLIMTSEAKVAAMRACGVAEVEMVEFTAEIAALSPEEFAIRHLARGARAMPTVVCGENWRFGTGGRGDAELLRRMGFGVLTVPYAMHCGLPVSSSRIRKSIEDGDVETAAAMLGRPFSVDGVPFRGKGVGAGLGFPTVNLRPVGPSASLLPLGVYAAVACGAAAVANYGVAPTMGANAWPEPVLELHFVGEPPAIPDDGVKVGFLRFIRHEKRFSDAGELRCRIEADADEVRSLCRGALYCETKLW